MSECGAKSLNSDPHPCFPTEVMTYFSSMSQQKPWTSWEIFHGTKWICLEDSLILASTFSDLSHRGQCLIGPTTLLRGKKLMKKFSQSTQRFCLPLYYMSWIYQLPRFSALLSFAWANCFSDAVPRLHFLSFHPMWNSCLVASSQFPRSPITEVW